MRTFPALLLSACLAAPFALPAAVAAQQVQQQPQITVTGEGEAAAAPDMATISLGVEVDGDTAAAAMDGASDVVSRILDRLEGFEVAPRDVQTSSLSLDPLRTGREGETRPRIDGYVARNQVTVRVRDLDQVGQILGAVLEDGANTLGGLDFAVADPDPLIDEARRAAVADARAKAELYAEAAGVRLGRVLRLDEVGGMPRPMPMAEMRMAADVPVAGGETGYSAQVSVVFELLQ
ncbi:SIMPL domain-containing protein [Roseivivax isoporae]|uniref:26 kDa periplasmic immunogenic protein n=1 Tax=Roseivivax isoporae LMG 25204 TaxID=1449351 RepID=X7F1W2_9RHOB|nr:SIMPL domain-containing protein [Roseivivax isoporae]ETX26780.1 hypothetical protein RISW2_19295 [Roseivivax isoporae LMG 25204]